MDVDLANSALRYLLIESAQPFFEVRPEARLAHFAIRNDVEACLDLFVHCCHDGISDAGLELAFVDGLSRVSREHHVAQIGGSDQAAGKVVRIRSELCSSRTSCNVWGFAVRPCLPS